MLRFTLFFLGALLSFSVSAQNFLYSDPLGNYPFTSGQIIGRVNKNIIIFENTFPATLDMRKSEMLVYDDEMRLLKTTALTSILPKNCTIDFLNEGNSFSAIVRYAENNAAVCMLVNFDADANVLRTQILDQAAPGEERFEIVTSADQKSFALLRIVPSEMAGTIGLQYRFIKGDSLIRSDMMVLPFDLISSGIGHVLLDDDKLILPINDTANDEKLTVFKIDLSNNSSENTIRTLNYGRLNLPTLRVAQNDEYYIVTSQYKTWGADMDKAPDIFLWQMRKDLTDITGDTIITNLDTSNPCLQSIYHYQLNSIGLKNNSSNIIIAAGYTTSGYGDYFSGQGSYNRSSYHGSYSTGAGSFYEGRVMSMAPQKDLNGNSYDNWSNVVHGPTWSNYTGAGNSPNYKLPSTKVKADPPTLAVLNIDAQNKINWGQCFNVDLEKNFTSLVNESVILVRQNSLHIIYLKSLQKNKLALGEIVLDQDGTYEIKPVISMNIKYKYLLRESLQISEDALIVGSSRVDLQACKLEYSIVSPK